MEGKNGREETHLEGTEYARVAHTGVARQETETSPEDIEVPQYLKRQTKVIPIITHVIIK